MVNTQRKLVKRTRNSWGQQRLQGKVQLAPRKTKAKKRRTRTARRRRPRGKRKGVSREAHINVLIVILMFLYMLRLMDEKTFKRIQKDLAPKKRTTKRRRPRS